MLSHSRDSKKQNKTVIPENQTNWKSLPKGRENRLRVKMIKGVTRFENQKMDVQPKA